MNSGVICALSFCRSDITKVDFKWINVSGLIDMSGKKANGAIYGGHRFLCLRICGRLL